MRCRPTRTRRVRLCGEDAATYHIARLREYPLHLCARSVFRRRHSAARPIALYGGGRTSRKRLRGTVDTSAVKSRRSHCDAGLMGANLMSLPDDTSVRFAGFLSESNGASLEAANVVIFRRRTKLSLLALEAISLHTGPCQRPDSPRARRTVPGTAAVVSIVTNRRGLTC